MDTADGWKNLAFGASIAVLAGLIGSGTLLSAHLVHALMYPSIPLDPHIPNEQILIAEGLSGTPGPDQPTRPIAVDRVLVDGAATYVQYHLTGSLPRGSDMLPALTDDRGTAITSGAFGGVSASQGAMALPAWFPWHSPVIQRGYDILGPLPATARAAVLRFTDGETVRVSLDLRALARQRVRLHGKLVRQGGLQLRVAEVTASHVSVAYAPSADPMGVTLTTPTGRAVPLTKVDDECGGASAGLLACRAVWVFPLQRRGTHLTLTIRSFTVPGTDPSAQGLGPGPWRFVFVIP